MIQPMKAVNVIEKINTPFLLPNAHKSQYCALIDMDGDDIELFLKTKLSHNNIYSLLYKGYTHTHHSRFDQNFFNNIIEQHINITKRLVKSGYNKIIIAANNDSIWQKSLSPRFVAEDLTKRMKPFLQLYDELKKIAPETIVLLNVEELAPGGMDATDGIKIAQALEKRGLKTIIASSGTKDFPILSARRATKEKPDQEESFSSNHPDMACAWWLREHTSLNVGCFIASDDLKEAISIAQQMSLKLLLHCPQAQEL